MLAQREAKRNESKSCGNRMDENTGCLFSCSAREAKQANKNSSLAVQSIARFASLRLAMNSTMCVASKGHRLKLVVYIISGVYRRRTVNEANLR